MVKNKMATTDTKNASFRFIEPVLQLPSKRKHRIYDDIINEFVASGLKCAEVKNVGRNPMNVRIMLSVRLKERTLENIKAIIRNQKVYLIKVDVQKRLNVTEH